MSSTTTTVMSLVYLINCHVVGIFNEPLVNFVLVSINNTQTNTFWSRSSFQTTSPIVISKRRHNYLLEAVVVHSLLHSLKVKKEAKATMAFLCNVF